MIAVATTCTRKQTIIVGSKNFTESVLLGEIIAQRLVSAGCTVDRKLDLGGTLVCDKAILAGDLDVYPEYSGTALTAILKRPITSDRAAVMRDVQTEYAKRGLNWGPPLGFENTFAIIVRRVDAERHGLRRISDLGYNPSWSPDGREVVCSTVGVSGPGERGAVGQLWRLDVATGARRRIATGDAVQPSWSPNNLRIAYWGVPAGTSRRVIWTVPADGGEPLVAVDDDALNWSPAWSPDGRFLYFASDRSGSMSLWRIPIDEASGRPRGTPQPITAPTPSGALPSLSRDGHHIVFATENHRSNLFLVPFDPVSFEAAGVPRSVIEGSRVVRSAEMSPDGSWIVFDTAEPQEDVFLVRPDGTGLRALTSDLARDRGPHWSGDGRRLLFYSDRSGRYEAWTATLPGGALERLTALPGEVLDPLWSPDGRALVYSRRGAPIALLDLGQPLLARVPRSLPASFAATSWSPDGAWLAGTGREGIVLYSFASRQLQALPEQGSEVAWLRDGRTLLFLRGGAVFALDRLVPGARRVLDPPQGYSFERLSVGPGDRTLVLVRIPTEGYLSMLTLR